MTRPALHMPLKAAAWLFGIVAVLSLPALPVVLVVAAVEPRLAASFPTTTVFFTLLAAPFVLLPGSLCLLEWSRLVQEHGGRADRCPQCRYDLRATTGPVCPECGTMLSAE